MSCGPFPGWLAFNRRVLEEAADPANPLLDRLHFLSITASNRDEFFMVRVGGLHLLAEAGVTKPDDSGLTPAEHLEAISGRVREMVKDQYACYGDLLASELARTGVPIRLNVRGICCLRPGLPECTDTITVTSIVDRFLEHARVFYFHDGGEKRVWISSADWMPRNLNRRIELMVPIEKPSCKRRLIEFLETLLSDTAKARRLGSDGSDERVRPTGRAKPFQSQEQLCQKAQAAVKALEEARPTQLVPHRPPARR